MADPAEFDQHRAPLLAAVRAEADRACLRLHTPAHQGEVDPDFAVLMDRALAADLTELDQTDDLRQPEGPIAEAQALAAAFFGAERSFFLVGGASVGNVASLLAIRPSCESTPPKLVIGRNAHVSAISGIVLANWEPVWVEAPWDGRWGVACPPPAVAFAAALERHPDAVAVFATAPSYYGDAGDLVALRAAVGERILIVDEAHGAHCPRALAAGADLVVHSAHKGLGGPTGGGYLHQQGPRVDGEAVAAALRLLQSTSPNDWILAGLDAARRQAATGSLASWDLPSVAALARQAEVEIRATADPTRLLVRFSDGLRAYDALAARGLVAEAALPGAVLLLMGLASRSRAHEIGEHLAAVAAEVGRQAPLVSPPPPPGQAVLSPREAALAPALTVPVARALGEICAESVCPYPPGIPVLVPGERIGETAIAHLAAVACELSHLRVVRP